MLYDTDIDSAPLNSCRVAVLGYGAQGRAQALNLRDAGVDVVVGLRAASPSRERAAADGVAVADVAAAAADADVVAMLMPDEAQPAAYRDIEPVLGTGATLVFAHGFNIHYRKLEPRPDLGVTMVAPFGIGEKVRELYTQGHGAPGMIAVAAGGDAARALALAYAKAIGLARGGVIETSFAEETETDLFAEQAVLCGGLTHLITAAFEALAAAGYSQEIAYFCCLHEVRFMADVIQRRGIAAMRESISTTAAYGDATRGPRIVNEKARAAMTDMLAEIRDGRFAAALAREAEAGFPLLEGYRREAAEHPLETIGRRLRASAGGDEV